MPESGSQDPDSPTRRIDPVGTPPAQPPREGQDPERRGATRRPAPPGAPSEDPTRILGRDDATRGLDRQDREDPAQAASASRPATAVLPRPVSKGSAAPRGRLGEVLGAPLEWLARKAARALIGPAGELGYAVPAELRKRYTVHGHIGSGGEAVVHLAEPQRPGPAGSPVALKLYRPGHDLNRALLERLHARTSSSPFVPRIDGYGHATSPWGEDLAWEAQEYFPLGSMRSLLDQAPMEDSRARDVVAGVAACLRFWQEELQHNHTDVKPENLLLRRQEPPVFALTDFGGAVRATMSRVYGEMAVTDAYAAPEVVEGRREAPAAWWSLGVMVHELATGRRPDRGGDWLAARNAEVDVSAIGDQRWRLLARGLLTPTPAERWGYEEVNQWLAGEEPRVSRPRRHAALRFGEVDHDDPPSLAFDLMDRSDKGAVWLASHWQTLRTWLDREVNDYTFDRAHLTVLAEHPERAHRAISALAAHFVPGIPPRYRGHDITAEGLLSLAAGDGSRQAVVHEAVEAGVTELAARHWCHHPECRSGASGRCARLERVHHEVPLIISGVRERVRSVQGTGAAAIAEPGPHEWNTAWAQATELVLDPEAPQRYRRMLRSVAWHPLRRSEARRAEWWREQTRTARRTGLGESGALAAQAALVTAVLLLPSADRAGAVQRELRTAERRQSWQDRRQRWAAAASSLLSRGQRPRGAAPGEPPGFADPEPSGRGGAARRAREERRVRRGMRQIERAMGAGRCRRFALPMAWLGLFDGLGVLLLYSVGLRYPSPEHWIAVADSVATAVAQSIVLSPLVAGAGWLIGLVPADLGRAWGFAVVLAIVLWLCGRIAAGHRRRARVRLAAYRLAVVGSVLMLLRLFASGLLMAVYGVLIPLSMVAG